MLMAGLIMPAIAQEKVEVDGWKSIGTTQSYDRQTQGSVYPMTQRHSDGFIGATWTNEDNPPFSGSTTPLRGIGYSYSTDGGQTWSEPESRVGGIPIYWPSYAQWGANGEAILGRSADSYTHQGTQIKDGLVLLTRTNKGQGAWTIRTIPYPAGTPLENGWIMAWARMITSGENNQYVHIMTHTRSGNGDVPYQGYTTPVFYYRTSDGGVTWDHEAVLVPEIAGMEWGQYPECPVFTDKISMAQHGDVIAASFISLGDHSYILKSVDNGNTWTATKFYDAKVHYYGTPQQYAETCYAPCLGTIAVDNFGMVHVAFAVQLVSNSEEAGNVPYYTGATTSFLSYWNENMATLSSDDYTLEVIDVVMDELIDVENLMNGTIYVKSTTPKWPIIGFYTPDPWYGNTFIIDNDAIQDWGTSSYGIAGLFSFPQMVFDENNTLHLAYLGIISCGIDGYNRWYRHPYYTATPNGGENWIPREYLVNYIDVIDQEFAYLTLAGIDDNKWLYLMAQVDVYAGTYTPYAGYSPDHASTLNHFYHFRVHGGNIGSCFPATNLTVNYTAECKAVLTWNPPSQDDFTYKIYRDGTLLATLNNVTSYTDTGFDATAGHIWKITVVCPENESFPISVTKPACTVPPCNPVTGATATVNCKKATLAWTAVAGSPKYKVSRDGVVLATVTTPQYTENSTFEGGKTYIWEIVTVCAESESDAVEVSAVADCPPCPPITDATATINCSTAYISWMTVAGAKGYKILKNGGLLATLPGTAVGFEYMDDFELGKTYKWDIITICEENESEKTEVAATADCVGINELLNNVAIYPNPVSGMITIEATDFEKVEVYNPVGQLIETRTVKTFDVSSYDAGLYFFKVYDINNNSITKRIMVAK